MGGIRDRTGLHHRLVDVTNLAEATEPGSTAAVLTRRTSGPRLRHRRAPCRGASRSMPIQAAPTGIGVDPGEGAPHEPSKRPPSRPQTTVRPQGGGQDHCPRAMRNGRTATHHREESRT